MLVKSYRLSVNFPSPSSMRIGNSEVFFTPSVKNLCVTLDCNLNMTQHVLNICRLAYIELRQTGSMRHLLNVQTTQTLVCAFILSRLDYCNCLLAGCPQFLIDRFRKFRTQLHDLSVGKPPPPKKKKKNLTMSNPFFSRYTGYQSGHEYRTKFPRFSVITCTGPQYLSELLHLYIPSRDLRSSADTRILKFPRSNSKALVRGLSHMSVPLPGTVYHALSAILTLRHHLDRF